MSYQDGWGRFHDKPCYGNEPSSNNGWIYSAYAKQLGLELNHSDLHNCFDLCWDSKPFNINRSPGKKLPPMSRDEILGMIALEMFPIVWLERNHWQFCNLPGFKAKSLWDINWFKAVKALWKIRNAHRNALWTEPDLYQLGFRLMPQDTWYALKKNDCKVGLIHSLYFYISSISTVFGKDNASGKLILWLKLKDLKMEGSMLYKYLEWEDAFYAYFGPNHPFTIEVKK